MTTDSVNLLALSDSCAVVSRGGSLFIGDQHVDLYPTICAKFSPADPGLLVIAVDPKNVVALQRREGGTKFSRVAEL